MTIAFILILNVAAVAALLVLLTATMRLPYHLPLPRTPPVGRVDARANDHLPRRPQARPAGQRSSDRRDV